jgi:predicted helicase
LCDKQVKLGKKEDAVFRLFTNSVKTNRDEWLYDFSKETLTLKTKYFVESYNKQLKTEKLDGAIKWSGDLESKLKSGDKLVWNSNLIKTALWKPFVKQFFYAEKVMSDRMTENHYQIFGRDFESKNKVIMFVAGSRLDFSCLAANQVPNYAIYSLDPAQCLPLYRYNVNSGRQDNITVWGVVQFRNHYGDQKIMREDIFHYTYAVLHHPAYRRKYALNLKREFPRLPFYEDFRQWAAWGRELMDLHINYETAKPFKLKRVDAQTNSTPRTKLKADKTSGIIELDSETVLQGVPADAWEYKLGNRSALEWILDQYKEKKPSDATIAEKFNTYALADYKETVIDLLKRVCTVSVKTVEIINQMPEVD